MSNPLVVLSTFPSLEGARETARKLVEEKQAACINIIPGVHSIYSWENVIHDDAEVLLVIKTNEAVYPSLERAIVEHHPYDCPEVVALPMASGYAPYLSWISSRLS